MSNSKQQDRPEDRAGRPRSERARLAVLRAVDDMLVEQGYAALTMKGIAERAGVGRQTVYRWWNSKAEILMEASVNDAREELVAPPRSSASAELVTFLELVERFLTVSPAGLAYRALLGESQDPTVAALIADHDPLGAGAELVLERVRPELPGVPSEPSAAAQLVGPVLYQVLVQPHGAADDPIARTRAARSLIADHVSSLITRWAAPPGTTHSRTS